MAFYAYNPGKQAWLFKKNRQALTKMRQGRHIVTVTRIIELGNVWSK